MPHGPDYCKGATYAPYDIRTMCRVCWLKLNPNRKSFTAPATPRRIAMSTTDTTTKFSAYALPVVKPACEHLGSIREWAALKGCDKHVYDCAVHDRCRLYAWRSVAGVACCEGCADYSDGTSVPSVGVSIGSYNMPSLIELQVKMIRQHCGDVPILIVDDCSDGYGHTPDINSVCGRLRNIAASYPNVVLFIHPTRLGHASGDLSKVWMGIQWAAARNIKILATLSQRFLIDKPNWLQDGAKELLWSKLATACQPCKEGNAEFPLRSEAMLLDVDRWNQPAILDHLIPRRMTPIPGEWGVAAEYVYMDDIKDRLDGKYAAWSLFGPDRGTQYPGVIWHCSHQEKHYHVIAQKFGITLDPGFTCNGWRALQGQSYQG